MPRADEALAAGCGAGCFDVTDYGATGDGSSDDSSAIQDAVDAALAAGGGTVFFPAGTYKLLTPLDLGSRLSIVGMTGSSIIDMSQVGTGSTGHHHALRASGTAGPKTHLSANAVRHARSVTASGSGIVAGDWIQVGSVGDYYPKAGTNHDSDRGEIKRVRDVAGSTVTFDQELYDSYPTAAGAFIRKLNMVTSVSVSGLGFKSDSDSLDNQEERGIDLHLVDGFRIADCDFTDIAARCVSVMSSIRGQISGCNFAGTNIDEVAAEPETFYGVCIADSAQWIRVWGCHAERLRRHSVTVAHSHGQDCYGQPRFIEIIGNTGSQLIREMFEQHGQGEHIDFSHNRCDGCDGLIRIEGHGVSCCDNEVVNFRKHAIVFSDIGSATDITVARNRIGHVSAQGISSARAIWVHLADASTIRNLFIEDNEVLEWTVPASPAIEIANETVSSVNLVLARNKVYCSGERSTYAIRVTTPRARIVGNIVRDSRYGITATGDEQEIAHNDISLSGQDTAGGYAIDIRGGEQRVLANRGSYTYVALRLAATASRAVIQGNMFRVPYATRLVSDGGSTGAVFRDNHYMLDTGQDLRVACSSALTLPAPGNHGWRVTGTGTITSITPQAADTQITLRFSTGVTVSNGSNLRLAGSFNAGADDTLTLMADGTNWYEISRSAN